MEVHPTPRQMAKMLLNGIAPPRPLLLPIVFSLGTRVENVTSAAFLNNPTKISNSLRQIRSHLRSDGVACYFDPYLEVEALGATLEHFSDDRSPLVHWPARAEAHELPDGVLSPEEAAKRGRVPLALEVVRRMSALPQRDFLLMAGVTGPLTLAARILEDGEEKTLNEEVLRAAEELAAAVTTQIASAFVGAGADLIIIQEEVLPTFSAERCEMWATLLAPAINVIRFYEALPLLQLSASSADTADWDAILQRPWDCVVSLPIDVMASLRGTGTARKTEVALGVSLPLDAFRADRLLPADHGKTLHAMVSDLRPLTITTAADLPAATDMKRLIAVLGDVGHFPFGGGG
jgi:hypothetical protein